MPTTLLLCDCGGTQPVDRDAIARATGHSCPKVGTALCTTQAARVAEALSAPEADVIVACRQEAPAFEALAEELDVPAPLCIDIRDRAGWSDEGAAAAPKMAALLALGARPRTPAKTRDVVSDGVCLVIGPSEAALAAAEDLADALAVTALVTDLPEILPGPERRFDVVHGRLRRAAGAFGRFEIAIDGFRAARPEGRGPLGFDAPRDGAKSTCDVILDLTGGTPLFPAHEKREGYLRPDPGDPRAVARAVFEAAQMVGTFEKTLFVELEPSLCAHSRARQTGCTRCLDVCPTGAILPDGDAVTVDADICAGCGACSAVCPSQAIAYDDPPVGEIMGQIRALGAAYREAGGRAARLLVHDAGHGREMIALAARMGRGLPAAVIPFEIGSLAAFGHAEAMAALACGFDGVEIVLGPRADRDTLGAQAALVDALTEGAGLGTGRMRLLDLADPDALSDALYAGAPDPIDAEPILPLGRRRDVTRLAVRALAPEGTAPIALPAGAPYGAVAVDRDACTLCLSCVSLCPSGALLDNPDKPQLTFTEDACLQCGLCANICPEDAITLDPRLDPSDAALAPRIMNEEEPFECISCGTPFGVASTIERIVEKLASHSMFINSDNVKLIQMCDDCRVKAQYHSDAAPFAAGNRPRTRTTDDYKQ
ncbi:4Fe-4S dicluster domain-containing protein [Palleronia sediminis]|uniref:4Fe-4S dicluster domain-containing protein n=1 Tax=Palleronia sediminis TaxID=2547833 RepID=A0A4R6A700_9RHOB|nr:4Fe-4S binding protein [Palleronia sediminis]TDL79511.1 4Fe-4S dicluster domain-containing protein [Palleronia sediminis]